MSFSATTSGRPTRASSTDRTREQPERNGPRGHLKSFRQHLAATAGRSGCRCRRRGAPRFRGTGTTRHPLPPATDPVLVVVNLDPHHTQEATVPLGVPQFGRDWQALSVDPTSRTSALTRHLLSRLRPTRSARRPHDQRPYLTGSEPEQV
ncbi:hypothetical protein ACH4XT_01365 [Streptomyces avidinii]|uniref:hypothetical protein n=1 Tax=Streptomyces avidinii TaxID=1895 RepID=UPI0037AFF9ED